VLASPVDGAPASRHDLGADGRFEFGPWSPRTLRLSVERPGERTSIGDFGVHEMRVGTTTDVGDLVLSATGSARLRITGGEAEGGVAALFRDGRHVDEVRITKEPVAWQELSPGNYSVAVTRARGVPLCGFAEFELVPGMVNEVVVAVAAGNRRQVQVETGKSRPPATQTELSAGPAESPRPEVFIGGRTVVLSATDATGRTLMLKGRVPAPAPDGSQAIIVLPVAAIELFAASEDGWTGSAKVSGDGTEPILVRLARK